MKKMIYLGRLTVAVAIAAGNSQDLTGGDPITQLEGYQVCDVIIDVRTPFAKTDAPTVVFETTNGVDVTTATDPTGMNLMDRDAYGPINSKFDAGSVAGAVKATVAGAGSVDAGECDVYAEIFFPRAA